MTARSPKGNEAVVAEGVAWVLPLVVVAGKATDVTPLCCELPSLLLPLLATCVDEKTVLTDKIKNTGGSAVHTSPRLSNTSVQLHCLPLELLSRSWT